MRAANVLYLGVKEFSSLLRDPMMLLFVLYAFTLAIYSGATAPPETLNRASIAIVDEDRSILSERLTDAFYPPNFLPPVPITRAELDARMDADLDTFALDIPPNFQRDLLAGRDPTIQLNVDATHMSQAFTGNSDIQTILTDEINAFVQGDRGNVPPDVGLTLRARFNPELDKSWFGAIMQLINNVTLLSVVLTGAALIREREHGTVEHLLAMPVTPFEIMLSKVWAMGLVVFLAALLSLIFIIRWLLAVPIEGSIILFMVGTALHLFATTSLGIFLATVSRSMPQFGLLLMLIIVPLQELSGASTPRESMPEVVQYVMLVAPNTHFVMLAQAILYRGAGLAVVWPQFLGLALIGAALFAMSLARFRKTLAAMA